MPETTTITVDSLEEKSGTKDGRAWTKYALKDSGGTYYSTFDPKVVEPARGLMGQRATIEYEVSGKFKNLIAVRPSENGSAVPETYSHRGADGEPDWDQIALGKTRCALWNHFLSGQLAASLYAAAKSSGSDRDPMDYVITTGTRLVVHAEKDVFEREPGDDGVPF